MVCSVVLIYVHCVAERVYAAADVVYVHYDEEDLVYCSDGDNVEDVVQDDNIYHICNTPLRFHLDTLHRIMDRII
jgi:hypothetical protein